MVKTPGDVEQADVDRLRDLGWRDQDIFDAAYHGASMVSSSTVYKAFVR
ncbi:MAG: hypothetical protein JRJ38_05875 [Deltaproteobacteria bacterium]|nr:hypothetical protein [Deltaproteobacteria bacterium]